MNIDLDKIQECVRNLKPTDSIKHEWITDTILKEPQDKGLDDIHTGSRAEDYQPESH